MKWLAGALLAVVVLLQYRLWLSGDGVRELARLSEAVAQQKSENAEAVARNQQLVAEVADLKSGMTAIEERARSELGMIGRNETFYQVVPVRPRIVVAGASCRTHTDRRALIPRVSRKLRVPCATSSSSRPQAAAGDFLPPFPSSTRHSAASTVIEHALEPFEAGSGLRRHRGRDLRPRIRFGPDVAARRSRASRSPSPVASNARNRCAMHCECWRRRRATKTGSWCTTLPGPVSVPRIWRVSSASLCRDAVGGSVSRPAGGHPEARHGSRRPAVESTTRSRAGCGVPRHRRCSDSAILRSALDAALARDGFPRMKRRRSNGRVTIRDSSQAVRITSRSRRRTILRSPPPYSSCARRRRSSDANRFRI